MIISAASDEKLSSDFASIVSSAAGSDPFACRIVSLFKSYSPQLPFVDYWLVTDDSANRRFKGALARNGSVFLVYLSDNEFSEETSSFLRIAGAESILYDGKINLKLYGGRVSCGPVLKRDYPFGDDETVFEFTVPDIKELYALFLSCSGRDFEPPAFDEFYADVSHRLRHSAIRTVGILEGGALCAAAMTTAESESCAVVGAVACAPAARNKGFGSAVVKHLTNILTAENKTVYLHRAESSNEEFYDRLGFEYAGEWKEYRFGG